MLVHLSSRFCLLLATALICIASSSCAGNPRPNGQDADSIDLLSYFHRPGLITHARYTLLTFPWPTRSDAWLDFDNNRYRSWDVQITDQWDNPFVCTSMFVDDQYYLCLPSTESLPVVNTTVPVPFDRGTSIAATTIAGLMWTVESQLVGDVQVNEDEFEGVPVREYRWAASSPEMHESVGERGEFGYCDGQATPQFYYQLQVDMSGTPFVEVFGAQCDGIDEPIAAVLYHDIEFVQPSSLPDDFFDPVTLAERLLSRYFAPAAERFGLTYWLGFEGNGYMLTDIDWCRDSRSCVTVTYTPPFDEVPPEGEPPRPDLTLTTGAAGVRCPNEEPIESDLPNARLCLEYSRTSDSVTYSAYWMLSDGYLAELRSDWWGKQSRDDFLALLDDVRVYEGPPGQQQPFLTEEDVRLFIADALEVVCTSERNTIREVRDSAEFTYDEQLGEWYGTFGPFGDFTVNDSKPVAVPPGSSRGSRSTYPIAEAECARKEPTPGQ